MVNPKLYVKLGILFSINCFYPHRFVSPLFFQESFSSNVLVLNMKEASLALMIRKCTLVALIRKEWRRVVLDEYAGEWAFC